MGYFGGFRGSEEQTAIALIVGGAGTKALFCFADILHDTCGRGGEPALFFAF